MEQYIPKSALVAEIDRIVKEETEKFNEQCQGGYEPSPSPAVVCMRMEKLRSFLNTLEVREVDLEKEITHYFKGWGNNEIHCFAMMQDGTSVGIDECIDIAKHFFELGMQVNNPITAADRGTAEEIIINLKRVEQDYRIDLTKEIGWVRNKAQKGE